MGKAEEDGAGSELGDERKVGGRRRGAADGAEVTDEREEVGFIWKSGVEMQGKGKGKEGEGEGGEDQGRRRIRIRRGRGR